MDKPRFGTSTFIGCAVLIFTMMMLTSPAVAGQQEAAIIGQVTDESGAVLPGVTVTATSPALQVPSVATVTNERGEYRLTPLPIGIYMVDYSLAGFQTVRHEGLRLTVGFTASVDVRLKVGSLAETITVSGASPVVDLTSTTASTQFTRETIELIPSSRNGVVSLLAQAPGVRTLRDVGGSSINQVPTFRVFGQAGEPFATLEGVQTSSLQASGGQANYWDYTTIEEAQVNTIGNGAEVPSRGVNLNAVVKSGSNAFHSTMWLNKTSSDLQSKNIDADLAARGVTIGPRLVTRESYSADLGGRIIRDKLWFYASARRALNGTEVINTYKPDGSPAVADDVAWFQTGKFNYQMTASNRFIGFYQYNHKHDVSSLDQNRTWIYRGGLMTPGSTRKIEWQKIFGSTLVTSLQYGFWIYNGLRFSYSPLGIPLSTDVTTLENKGPTTDIGQQPHNPRHHYKGTMTWFRPNLFQGNHEFKFGFDYTNSWFGRQYPNREILSPDERYQGAPTSSLYNYRLIFDNGAPYQLESYNNPAMAHVTVHYLATYAQDSWTLGRRLTLNLGARYAHDNGFVPESCRETGYPPANEAFPATCYPKQQFNIWDTVSPRLHASWNITGNGKTVIKGGYGLFAHPRQQVPELDAADPHVRTTVVYNWHDLNGNHDYDLGEVNLNPNLGVASGGDFVSQSGGTNTVANPNEREPKSHEFSLSLEHELMADFALRVSSVYSRYNDTYRTVNSLRPYDTYNIPVTRPDPGPDGRAGTADDPGVNFTYWEYSTALSGRQFERFMLTNDPNADQTFKSVDLSIFKRLTKRWQLLASYALTKRNVPIMPSATGSEFNGNVVSGDLTPNAEINTSDQELEWSGKVSGAYIFPLQILVSANLEHRSGLPYARQVRFTGGRTIPNITLNVEPVGTRRLPNTNQLDIRLEKRFDLGKGQKLSARMNVFNALNGNYVTGVTRLSGALFLRPTDIMDPRIAEFSLSYSF
jgi:Carboxypeptidase regulatory-like domain